MKPIPTLLLLICFLPFAIGADDPAKKAVKEDAKDPSIWMRMKLEYSQKILEGITKADFDLIEKNAVNMRGLNRFEKFVRGRWEGYPAQLETFQQANDELVKQARKENVEGAALAFTQMTISCVTCHKRLREQTK